MLWLAIVSFHLLDALTSKNEISQDRGELASIIEIVLKWMRPFCVYLQAITKF